MNYKLNHGMNGNICGIVRLDDGANIPLDKANTDYQEFIVWNGVQKIPLDLNSTIEPSNPEPVRDLAKEVTELKGRITILENI